MVPSTNWFKSPQPVTLEVAGSNPAIVATKIKEESEEAVMPRKTKSNEYIVYKHTNTANGKVYIGITSTSVNERSGSNGKNYKKNTLFYRAIEKYGWDAFSHEVVFTGISMEEAARREVELISVYNSTNPDFGYNISAGGEGGRAGVPYSDEERNLHSKLMSGENNPCYGKYGSDHPAFGCKHTAESRMAVSNALKGRVYSEETLKKMSDARKAIGAWSGDKNPMSGKTYGSAPHARKILCVDTGEVFDSVKRAAESVGVFSTSITATCAGRQKTCGGLHWEYADDMEVNQYAS